MIYSNILETVGGTPVIEVKKIAAGLPSRVFVKYEGVNPGGSIKDRAAIRMIDDAESRGILKKGGTIVEPTSGNTGIGLAMVAASRGYNAVIVMPDTMSQERISLMRAYGAEVVLTPGSLGMQGALDKAAEIARDTNGFVPQQFDNPSNPMSHYAGTAAEILEDVPDVDFVVAGIGTGGTVTGLGRAFRDFGAKAKVVGVEPYESPLLTEGHAGPHKIQGIGANFVPSNYDSEVVSEILRIKGDDAIAMTLRLASEEGILAGISSGAALCAALEVAARGPGKKILAILPDKGDRYLSTGIFD